MTDNVPPPPATVLKLARRFKIWGIAQAILALALVIYGVAAGAGVSAWLLSGLIVTAAGGGLYVVAAYDLRAGRATGRGRVIIAALVSLNWICVASFLAVVNLVLHPDVVIGGGVPNLLVGFVLPALHLIGNIWHLVHGINLNPREWRPA